MRPGPVVVTLGIGDQALAARGQGERPRPPRVSEMRLVFGGQRGCAIRVAAEDERLDRVGEDREAGGRGNAAPARASSQARSSVAAAAAGSPERELNGSERAQVADHVEPVAHALGQRRLSRAASTASAVCPSHPAATARGQSAPARWASWPTVLASVRYRCGELQPRAGPAQARLHRAEVGERHHLEPHMTAFGRPPRAPAASGSLRLLELAAPQQHDTLEHRGTGL